MLRSGPLSASQCVEECSRLAYAEQVEVGIGCERRFEFGDRTFGVAQCGGDGACVIEGQPGRCLERQGSIRKASGLVEVTRSELCPGGQVVGSRIFPLGQLDGRKLSRMPVETVPQVLIPGPGSGARETLIAHQTVKVGRGLRRWCGDRLGDVWGRRQDDYRRLVEHEFMGLSGRYLELMEATQKLTSGLEPIFHNATTGFTLQLPVILAALTPDDDDDVFRAKSKLVAGALEIFVVRRMVNYRNFGYATVQYSMFNLMKLIRNRSLDEIRLHLGTVAGKRTRTARQHQQIRTHISKPQPHSVPSRPDDLVA